MSGPADGDTGAAASREVVCLLTRFRAVDDVAVRELAAELRVTAAAVEAEPGHRSYNVFVDQDDPTSLYVVEAWASAADARRHAELVVTNGAVQRVAPLLAEELTTRTLHPLPSEGVNA